MSPSWRLVLAPCIFFSDSIVFYIVKVWRCSLLVCTSPTPTMISLDTLESDGYCHQLLPPLSSIEPQTCLHILVPGIHFVRLLVIFPTYTRPFVVSAFSCCITWPWPATGRWIVLNLTEVSLLVQVVVIVSLVFSVYVQKFFNDESIIRFQSCGMYINRMHGKILALLIFQNV